MGGQTQLMQFGVEVAEKVGDDVIKEVAKTSFGQKVWNYAGPFFRTVADKALGFSEKHLGEMHGSYVQPFFKKAGEVLGHDSAKIVAGTALVGGTGLAAATTVGAAAHTVGWALNIGGNGNAGQVSAGTTATQGGAEYFNPGYNEYMNLPGTKPISIPGLNTGVMNTSSLYGNPLSRI